MKTNIKSVEINWMRGYGNSPRLILYVDKIPSLPNDQLIWNKTPNGYVWAEDDGLIQFIVYKPRSRDRKKFLGFAGREFMKTLTTGEVLRSNNWWSGGAYGMCSEGVDCLDVVIHEGDDKLGFSGFALRTEKVLELVKDHGIRLAPSNIGGYELRPPYFDDLGDGKPGYHKTLFNPSKV